MYITKRLSEGFLKPSLTHSYLLYLFPRRELDPGAGEDLLRLLDVVDADDQQRPLRLRRDEGVGVVDIHLVLPQGVDDLI